jgi:HEAT repeat protein
VRCGGAIPRADRELLQFLGLVRAPEAAVPVLLAGCDEALHPIALAALESMGALAEEAIDGVWSDLGSAARRDACIFFGRSEGPRSVERLVAALDDVEPGVRIEAARSLGVRGSAGALAPLVQRLQQASQDELEGDDERRVVVEALIALAGAEDDASGLAERAKHLLVESLEGACERLRVAVARVLGRIGRREDAEIASLLLKDPSAKVRRAAVSALVRLDPNAAAERLHLAIADESVDVRIAAASALGESASAEVFPDLCRLAEDADPRVRAAAVRAVGLGAGRADPSDQVEQLLDAACGDEPPVALAAIEVALANGDCLERMEALLHRPEPDVVREAIRCLGAHGAQDRLEAVIPLCAHPDWSVRAEAIQVLGEQRVSRAVPAILRRLDLEQDPFVRTVTLSTLQRLEG